MKTGGSNYVSINGLISETPVIGTYHEHRDEVATQLREMFEHGQRKITLVLWFAPLTFPGVQGNRWGHVLNSYGGSLSEQHRQNVVELLALVKQTGYNQINFRFANTLTAHVSQWTEWQPAQFQENWAFVDSVRSLVVANTDLPVIFDLGVEQANELLATSQLRQLYLRRTWRLYTDAHGPADCCGCSVLHGAHGLILMLRQFASVGLPYPGCYCFDAYLDIYRVLTGAAQALRNANEITKPVYIQETCYNDAGMCSEIKRAIVDTPDLNFKCIFQWPRDCSRDPHDFPDVYPRRYDNYLVET
jgi:hypothetical protein